MACLPCPHRCKCCCRRCSCRLSWTPLRHSFKPDLQQKKQMEEEEEEEENERRERERTPSYELSRLEKCLSRSVYGEEVHSSPEVSRKGRAMRRGFPHPRLLLGQLGSWRTSSSARVESVLDVCHHPVVSGEGGRGLHGQQVADEQRHRQTDR